MRYNQSQLVEVLKDASYEDIGPLPSKCYGYDWKTMHLRPFRLADYPSISKAAKLDNMDLMLDTIDKVITQDSRDLTIGDFYFVLMWLRFHSMPKTPQVFTWDCDQLVLKNKKTGVLIPNTVPYQNPQIRSDYEAVPCDAMTTESVHQADVQIIDLPDEGVVLPDGYDWPRARHIMAIREALADPEYALLAPYIQWMAGDTFEDRKAAFLAGDNDTMATAAALNSKYQHGISETVKLTCRNCRYEHYELLNVDPSSFFQ